MDDIEGRTAVVTGASRGLGRAVAERLGAAGAHVVVCARAGGDGLEGTVAAIEDAGGTATAQAADVRDEFDVERLFETAARVAGSGIDLVVANAGVYHHDGAPGETALADEAYAVVDDHFRTNARGVFATVREAVPHLASGARVLVPSGTVARDARDGYGSYAVSKAAAEALARQFDAELDARVLVVDPGQVATDLAGGRGRDPADVAGMFAWAATTADPPDVCTLRDWKTATR